MNKDEINDLTNILRNHCDNTPNEDCVGCDCDECDAKAVINAGYRKVADDEIVESMKTYERASKETAREILQAINKYLVGTRGIYTVKTFRNGLFEDILLVRADDLETLVNKLAKEHDVELEE